MGSALRRQVGAALSRRCPTARWTACPPRAPRRRRRAARPSSTVAQRRQAVRHLRRAGGVSLQWRRASSSPSSARPAAARRRCCGPSPGSIRRPSGAILQAGRDITALPPSRRDFGIVFQSYALFPNLTVAREHRLWPARRRPGRSRGSRQRVDELLASSAWPSTSPKYPAQLSGGQQQRVALARALANGAGAAAAGRTALGARRHRAAAPAPGDPRAATPPRRDHHHGHARPGGGDGRLRPHRGDEPRARSSRSARRRRSIAGPPAPSSPASSAAPRASRRW